MQHHTQHDTQISKLSLLLNFGQVEAEILGLEHTWGHFHFSHEYVRNYLVSAVVITVLDLQNLRCTSCITFSDIFHTNHPGFNQKITTILIFKNLLLKLLREIA